LSWLDHDATTIGAALAFYTLLSLAPLVILSIAAGSLLFGGTATEQHLIRQVREVAGSTTARFVQVLAEQAHKPSSGASASVIGFITLFVGASGIFAELRSALNRMWDIHPQGGSGFLAMIRERLLSIGMVLAVGFLLVVSLVVSTALAAVGKFFGGLLPMPPAALNTLNFVLSFAGISVMFALVLRYVPDARLRWRAVSAGAIMSALLFTAGKSLISFYLGRAAVGSLYGAGGATVALTAWVYYSALLFLFGAEFTCVYDHSRDARRAVLTDLEPSERPRN
jgi:membrane protein